VCGPRILAHTSTRLEGRADDLLEMANDLLLCARDLGQANITKLTSKAAYFILSKQENSLGPFRNGGDPNIWRWLWSKDLPIGQRELNYRAVTETVRLGDHRRHGEAICPLCPYFHESVHHLLFACRRLQPLRDHLTVAYREQWRAFDWSYENITLGGFGANKDHRHFTLHLSSAIKKHFNRIRFEATRDANYQLREIPVQVSGILSHLYRTASFHSHRGTDVERIKWNAFKMKIDYLKAASSDHLAHNRVLQ